MLQEVPGSAYDGLVVAGYRAHPLRGEADASALPYDARYPLHGRDVEGEVLLGDDVGDAKDKSKVAAEELVIADEEIKPLRVGGAHKPDVIDAGLVVIDEEAGALAVVDVDFPGVMDVVFGLKHVLDHQLV